MSDWERFLSGAWGLELSGHVLVVGVGVILLVVVVREWWRSKGLTH